MVAMHDEQLKAAVGDFLRHVNHTAQREIEKRVREALASGKLKRLDQLPAEVSLHSDLIGLDITIHSRIEL
jgi:hypothetical protein